MRNRWLLMIALCAALGCGNRTRTVGGGGAGGGGTDPGADRGGDETGGDPSEPMIRKALHIAVELQVVDPDAEPKQTAVDLVMTDETGANDRAEIGEFTGECTDTTAQHRADPMTPILSVDCVGADQGLALRFIHRQSELIVLRAVMYEGEEPSFDEHTRIALPAGVPVKTDHEAE